MQTAMSAMLQTITAPDGKSNNDDSTRPSAPYMHAEQFSTLPEVIRHYVKAPETVIMPTRALCLEQKWREGRVLVETSSICLRN